MLFDHGVPAPLRWSLGDHSVDLAKDYGWDTYQNGELLDAVEAECYEVFITTDMRVYDINKTLLCGNWHSL